MVTPDWGRREKGGLGSMWLVLAPHLATLDGPLSHLLCSYCRYTGKLTLEGVAGTLNLPLSLLSMPFLLVASKATPPPEDPSVIPVTSLAKALIPYPHHYHRNITIPKAMPGQTEHLNPGT